MIKKVLAGILIILIAVPIYIIFFRTNLILNKDLVKKEYTTPISKFLKWRGGDIHYTDDGSGPTVLMIHGFGGCYRDFRILDSLINNHYRVIRIDLPGFGLSDFPKVDGADPDYNKVYSDFFNFFLDTLHLDSMYVCGNSMGGMAAWELAVEHPNAVKKLVLFNAAGYDMQSVIKVAAGFFRHGYLHPFFERGMTTPMVKAGFAMCFANKSIVTDDMAQHHADMLNKQGNLQTMFALATTSHFLDTTEIKKVSCPTLIVWGKEDVIVPYNHAYRFHRDIKNSRVILYSPCGHVPMIERPLEVQKDVEKFFAE